MYCSKPSHALFVRKKREEGDERINFNQVGGKQSDRWEYMVMQMCQWYLYLLLLILLLCFEYCRIKHLVMKRVI